MAETLRSFLKLTGSTPSAQEARRTATGVVALIIWMNETLRYRYVKFPQIKLKLKNNPIGTIALRYTFTVIATFFRPSSRVVVRASSCVMMVAKVRCHAVRRTGYWNLNVDKIHLLKRITLELRDIQIIT